MSDINLSNHHTSFTQYSEVNPNKTDGDNQITVSNAVNPKRIVIDMQTVEQQIVVVQQHYDGYIPQSVSLDYNLDNKKLIISLMEKPSSSKNNYNNYSTNDNYLSTADGVDSNLSSNILITALIYLWGTILPKQNASLARLQEIVNKMMVDYSKNVQSLTNVSLEMAQTSYNERIAAANLQIFGGLLSGLSGTIGTVVDIRGLSLNQPKALTTAEANIKNIKELEESLKPIDDALKDFKLDDALLNSYGRQAPEYKIEDTLQRLDAVAERGESIFSQGERVKIIGEHSNQVKRDYENMKTPKVEIDSIVEEANQLKTQETQFSSEIDNLIKSKNLAEKSIERDVLTKMKDNGTIFHKDGNNFYVLIYAEGKAKLVEIDKQSKKSKVLCEYNVSEDFSDSYFKLVNNNFFAIKNHEDINYFKSVEVQFYTEEEAFSNAMKKFIDEKEPHRLIPEKDFDVNLLPIESINNEEHDILQRMQREVKSQITLKDEDKVVIYRLVPLLNDTNKTGVKLRLLKNVHPNNADPVQTVVVGEYKSVPKDLLESYDLLKDKELNTERQSILKNQINDRKKLLDKKLISSLKQYAKYKEIKNYCTEFNKHESEGSILSPGGAFNKHLKKAEEHIRIMSAVYRSLATFFENISRFLPQFSDGFAKINEGEAGLIDAMSAAISQQNNVAGGIMQQTATNLANDLKKLFEALTDGFLQALRAAIDGSRV